MFTLYGIIRDYKETNKIEKVTSGGCRRVTLTDDIKAKLLNLIEDDCTISLQSMIEHLNLSVHHSAVAR